MIKTLKWIYELGRRHERDAFQHWLDNEVGRQPDEDQYAKGKGIMFTREQYRHDMGMWVGRDMVASHWRFLQENIKEHPNG